MAGVLYLKLSHSNEFDDCLRSSFHTQFLHDVADVVAYGFFADEELPGYLFRGLVLDQEFEHFSFAIGQQRFGLVATLQSCHPSLWALQEQG